VSIATRHIVLNTMSDEFRRKFQEMSARTPEQRAALLDDARVVSLAAIELIDEMADAETLGDVAKSRGTSVAALLAERTGFEKVRVLASMNLDPQSL